jgi:RND family efflux transporter MFP subunit
MLKKIYPIILIFFIFIGCEKQNETVEETAVPVKVFEVKRDNISQFVQLTGSVEAENDAVIYAKLNEKIDKIFVKVGDKVGKDQVIAEQHNDVLQQSVEMAKAMLKSAESQNKLAVQNYDRMKMLFDQKAVSPQQYDQSLTQKQTADASLEQAHSQLKQAEENLKNSLIKAPFAGVVAAINFEEDQMVSAGQPVAQVVNSNSMKAKLTVSGSDINKIRSGQGVQIIFPSLPGKVYNGKVVRINKALNPVSNSLEIEVRILNPDENIRSGIFGKFNLELVTRENALVIPEAAVQQQTEVQINKKTGLQDPTRKYFIFKIVNDRAVLSEVKVGIRSDGRLEITDGLSADDKIVVVGQNIVKDGDLVKIIE